MRLEVLQIEGFGKFHNRRMEFGSGLNIVYGKNEAGKSTMHTFIKAMLFGLSRKRNKRGESEYDRYEPWKGGSYGGSMELSVAGRRLRIERDFRKDADDMRLTWADTEEVVEAPEETLKKLMGGLTENAYKNTISIGQLEAQTEKGMAGEFRQIVSNLTGTGSSELSYDRAIEYLENKKKELSKRTDENAVINYTRRMGRIRNLERELSDPKYENRLPVYTDLRDKMRERLEDISEEKEKLLLKLEKAEGTLSENGFSDMASVDAYEKMSDEAFAEYEKNSKALKNKAKAVFAVALCVLGVLSLAAAGYLFIKALSFPDGFFACSIIIGERIFPAGINGIIFIIAALILIVCGVLMLFRRRSRRLKLRKAEEKLKEIFGAHIGNEEISSASLGALKERLAEFRKLIDAVSRSSKELSDINEELIKLHENRDSCTEIIGNEEKLRAEVEDKLTELNSLKSEAEELKRIIAANNSIKEDIDALDLAKEKLSELSGKIRGSIGIHLNKEASRLIKDVTGGAYDSMDVSDDMEIFLNTENRMVPIESLSAGTMDQIYLALRISAVNLIERGAEKYPLIFDDSFALYDDDRLKMALNSLAKAEADREPRQMIIFSCHHREESFLDQAGIKYNLIRI